MDTSKVLVGGKTLSVDEIIGIAFGARPIALEDATIDKVRAARGPLCGALLRVIIPRGFGLRLPGVGVSHLSQGVSML